MATVDRDFFEHPFLTLADNPPLEVASEDDLRGALVSLSYLRSGQETILARGAKQYIKAVRHNDLWEVTTRNGSYFTLASFTAALSTDYSEREVRESRAAKSIWRRIRRIILSPVPERSLSTAQVQALFAEFYLRKKFSIPQSGA